MRWGISRIGEVDRTVVLVGGEVFDACIALNAIGLGDILGDTPDACDVRAIWSHRDRLTSLVERFAEVPGDRLGYLGPEDAVVLRPPVASPRQILCVGLNYRDHAAEVGLALPERPHTFAKLPGSLNSPGGDVVLPDSVGQLDYEVELALVIGRRVSRVDDREAADAIAGYAVVNDFSARDWQFAADGQLTLGKGFDTFLPMGPWVVTPDELPALREAELTCAVNGEVRQRGRVSDMVADPAAIVSFLSQVATLNPGDVIATGTPAGVAMGQPSRPFLRAGDRVTTCIEGIGCLENNIVQQVNELEK